MFSTICSFVMYSGPNRDHNRYQGWISPCLTLPEGVVWPAIWCAVCCYQLDGPIPNKDEGNNRM